MQKKSISNHFKKFVRFIEANLRIRKFLGGAVIDDYEKFLQFIIKSSYYIDYFFNNKTLEKYEQIGKNKLNILEKSVTLKKYEKLRADIKKLKIKFKAIMEDK